MWVYSSRTRSADRCMSKRNQIMSKTHSQGDTTSCFQDGFAWVPIGFFCPSPNQPAGPAEHTSVLFLYPGAHKQSYVPFRFTHRWGRSADIPSRSCVPHGLQRHSSTSTHSGLFVSALILYSYPGAHKHVWLRKSSTQTFSGWPHAVASGRSAYPGCTKTPTQSSISLQYLEREHIAISWEVVFPTDYPDHSSKPDYFYTPSHSYI